MTPDTIHLPDDTTTQPILRFIAATALADCVTVGYDGGSQVVRADRSLTMLSTGERHLWSLVASLAKGDLRDLLGHADSVSLAALSDLFARLAFQGMRMPEDVGGAA